MAKLLIVENENHHLDLIKQSVDSFFSLHSVNSISQAKATLDQRSAFDLIVANVDLPDGRGVDLCSWIRRQTSNNDTPFVFVTGKYSLEACVTCFLVGGDDFICHPFHPTEFRARIESKIRRFTPRKKLIFEAYGIRIDLRTHKAFISLEGTYKELNLTPIEFKLLHFFLETPGRAYARDEILDRIWGDGVFIYPRTADAHVSKLRKKLGTKSNLIHSIYGTGYRFSENNLDNDHQYAIGS